MRIEGLILFISFMLAGCGPTYTLTTGEAVSLKKPPQSGKAVLTSGEEIWVSHIEFGADSIALVDRDSIVHRIPARDLRQVQEYDTFGSSIRAAYYGALAGAGVGFTIGLVTADGQGMDRVKNAGVAGVTAAAIFGLYGFAYGDKLIGTTTYEFIDKGADSLKQK